MTHGHSPEHGIQSTPPATAGTLPAKQPYFLDREWEALQADDRHTAAVIVSLLTSIFVIGLLLYLGVCLAVINKV
jgi:hypothetical protein